MAAQQDTAPGPELRPEGDEKRARSITQTSPVVDDWNPPADFIVPDVIGAGKMFPRHREMLQASGIAPAIAFERGYRSVGADEAVGFNFSRKQAGAGLLIPLWNVEGKVVTFQLRRDTPRRNKKDGAIKYETPEGSRPIVDVPPRAQKFLRDVSEPLWITEGSKKADSAIGAGVKCIVSISGVFGWRGKGESGESATLPDWESIALKGESGPRTVYLAFDSPDIIENESVRNALGRLKRFLELRGAKVLIVRMEPLENGGKCGLDDYLARGGKVEDLIATATPDLPPPKEKPAFKNFTEVRAEKGVAFFAKTLSGMRGELFELTDGWPRAWREDLFIDAGGELRFIRGADDLTALIRMLCDREKRGYAWKDRGLDAGNKSFLTIGELVASLRLDNRRYDDVVEVPLEPLPKRTYVTRKVDVRAFPDAKGDKLREFLKFFRPASVADEALIQALTLTPLWGGPPGGRPLFVVTGPDGVGLQETGKTSLVEKLARIAGGVFRVTMEKCADSIGKQLTIDLALKRRVVLLDNLDETLFNSRELAEFVTAEELHGRPAFERQRARVNRLTWAATAVSPCLSPDLASRSMILHLDPPSRDADPTWGERVDEFIEKNRNELVADALALLKAKKFTIEGDPSRFPAWARNVLATHPGVTAALREQKERARIIDFDLENLALVLEEVAKSQRGPGFYGMKQLAEIWQRATGKNVPASWVGRKMKTLERRGRLPPGIEYRRTESHRGWYFHPEALGVSIPESFP